MLRCGLPSVTLLGEKTDYELILRLLDKLGNYGEEPTKFAELLKPVLKRFIQSFEDPDGEKVLDFWNRIFTSANIGTGADKYSGWITAFLFWDKDGKSLYHNDIHYSSRLDKKLPELSLDDVAYHRVSANHVPPGFCTVRVDIDDYGVEIKAEMLAGSIGMDCTSSGEETADGQAGMDPLQPRSGWWIYEKATE